MEISKRTFSRLKKISEGQFGTVYEVQETATGRLMAMKEICFNLKNRHLVDREIAIHKKALHANILKLEKAEVSPPYAFLFSEICKYDLRAFLQKSVFPLTKPLIQSLARDILQGLCALHEQGIYHRDIKPANILIDKELRAKICDFGSAVDESARSDGKFSVEGFTLWYKAPELMMGKRDYGHEIDIWSFGCVFAEMLNGAPLFATTSELELLGQITALLGDPTAANWAELSALPNFGKVAFLAAAAERLEDRFVEASAEEIDFLGQCVRYGARPSARDLLSHAFLQHAPVKPGERGDLARFVKLPEGDFFSILCGKFL